MLQPTLRRGSPDGRCQCRRKPVVYCLSRANWCWGDGGINLVPALPVMRMGTLPIRSPVRIGLTHHEAYRNSRHDDLRHLPCWRHVLRGDNAYGQCAIGDCGTMNSNPLLAHLNTVMVSGYR